MEGTSGEYDCVHQTATAFGSGVSPCAARVILAGAVRRVLKRKEEEDVVVFCCSFLFWGFPFFYLFLFFVQQTVIIDVTKGALLQLIGMNVLAELFPSIICSQRFATFISAVHSVNYAICILKMYFLLYFPLKKSW